MLSASVAPIQSPQIRDLRFLVVEDQDAQREALGRMLGHLGARRVYEAADGEAALAILRNRDEPVDIIVNALDMPGMDGLEFIRHVGLENLPLSVIFASRLDRPLIAAVESMTAAYGVKVLGVIEKPVTAEKLIAAFEPQVFASERRAESRPLSLVAQTPTKPTFPLLEIVKGLADNEFEPFFQPKVEMASGKIVGAKALARWRHREMGKVEADAFITPLEASGQIDELTWIMLKKAAACCTSWRAADVDATVSVRLALASLGNPGLADRVTELVCGQGLEPRYMVLEITGASAAIQSGSALENLARLRLRGFLLSVEDCGTGESSIKQLSRIAFTEIKVDRDFARNASGDDASRTQFLAMLAAARERGIDSVAEGVETQADWDLVSALGCDIAQGFFVAAPMEAAAYLEWAPRNSHWTPSCKMENSQ
jgi:EAL domain-containing protein (putative c-di-GMP-specific phosphodiesterase class I)/FixJ family two-component response regulator